MGNKNKESAGIGAINTKRETGHLQSANLEPTDEKYRKNIEAALRGLQNNVFRFKKNESGDMVNVIGEGQITERFDIKARTIKGKSLKKLFPNETFEQVEPFYRKAFTGEQVEFEMELRDTWFRTSLYPFEIDEHGKVVEIIGYSKDITERKKAKQALRDSEERYRILSEMATVGILIHDNGVALDGNTRVFNMFGYTPKELIGKNVLPITVALEYRDIVAKNIQRNFSEPYEIMGVHKDGTQFPVEVRSAKIQWEEKNARIGIIIDISERKKAEKLLKHSEEKYRGLYENLRDGCASVDMDGRITECNTAFQKMLGYDSSELFKLTYEDITPSKWHNLEQNIGENQIFKRGYSDVFEKELRRKDGTVFPVELQAYLLKDKDGAPTGVWALIRDISDRKAIEQQLRQSEKMEAIGQLAGGIAHDFNNQLAGIVGFADLLRIELENSPKLLHYVNNVLLASGRAADLTNQLLAYARRGKFQLIEVDLHKVLFEVVGLLQHTLDRKIDIKQKLNAQRPIITGDPSQIQNAFLNLALNARDAMPAGGELTFSTEASYLDEDYCRKAPYEIAPGNYIQICVKDSGTGMDTDTEGRIFEPFFTTKEQGKGTGMGLAAVYGTVKNHKGAIDVATKHGEGTTFTIYLPCSTAKHEYTANQHGTSDNIATVSCRILLVDDEPVVLTMATDLLSMLGHQVTPAASGIDAINTYKECWGEIDLVILDMIMPEKDGRETYLDMRDINPGVRVLFSSGYNLDRDAQNLLSEGKCEFIQKPYKVEQLNEKIRGMYLNK